VLFGQPEEHQEEEAAHGQTGENEQEAVEGEGHADENGPDQSGEREKNHDGAEGDEGEG